MAILEFLSPQAEILRPTIPPARRLDTLEGKTIALYWNLKAGGTSPLLPSPRRWRSAIRAYPSGTSRGSERRQQARQPRGGTEDRLGVRRRHRHER